MQVRISAQADHIQTATSFPMSAEAVKLFQNNYLHDVVLLHTFDNHVTERLSCFLVDFSGSDLQLLRSMMKCIAQCLNAMPKFDSR